MPEFIEFPDPSNEIQMFQNYYTLETALSDIIDNSISAGAKYRNIISSKRRNILVCN